MSATGLRWTSAGAVASPEALQIRAAPAFVSRIAVGAPAPSRALTDDEVTANVAHFTRDRSGPRDQPVRTVIVSGCVTVPTSIDAWRRWGVQRIVAHVDDQVAMWTSAVDEVVLGVHRPDQPIDADGATVNIELNASVLAGLGGLMQRIDESGARRVILTWPFPRAEAPVPPTAAEVVRALHESGVLERSDRVIKGLPPCTFARTGISGPPIAAGRTRNRWYVDSDHQRGAALLFFPDLVRFARPDSCRVCRWSDRCDGVADAWLALGLAGPLVPL